MTSAIDELGRVMYEAHRKLEAEARPDDPLPVWEMLTGDEREVYGFVVWEFLGREDLISKALEEKRNR